MDALDKIKIKINALRCRDNTESGIGWAKFDLLKILNTSRAPSLITGSRWTLQQDGI